ncbi:MAG TPA: DEAD/DEAH box helicase [Polyangiaceae bacterium]|nr:DEAD/DEAH box helicase [Polyangiaceae bacterium]
MPAPPWDQNRGLAAVTSRWLSDGTVRPCLAAERTLPPRQAELAPLPALLPGLVRALERRGIQQLYRHQREAVDAALAGRHVVVATPTASGKSLCFHLPVLQALGQESGSTALFLYPTKALSRDQEHGLLEMIRESELGLPALVFDGDTPGDTRRVAREKGRIVLTNPDMLHAGILPNHTKWASFFRGLRYVVLDELHTYRGVFGSHMAHVVSRLRRIAAFHGSYPTFVCATATIGNPREHAARLLGLEASELSLVAESTAPSAERRVFLYNPPIVNAELGVRKSTLKAAVSLTADLVRARVPTILFGPSRNSVEVMLKYLRESCAEDLAGRGLERAIMGYRGGYLPEMRREVERGLRDGEILCVVSTNALELGIDIGDLDAVVCAGYPGSIAGTWQRFGRAGRRGAESIAALVCSSAAVDQYLARDPAFLLEGQVEEARIDPNNAEILIQHLKCAAFEAPFDLSTPGPRPAHPAPAQGPGFGPLDAEATRDALEYLVGHGLLHHAGGRYHWAGEAFPASHVSLRNIGWDNFVIVDRGTPERPTEKTIGELDYRAAHTMLHEQAIYQQDAEQYQVEQLDFDNHKAFVRRVAPDYFTTALTYRSVEMLDTQASRPIGRLLLSYGDVKVIEKVTGYKKIKFFTHENSGYGDVHLPPMEMHTTSFALTVPEALLGEAWFADARRENPAEKLDGNGSGNGDEPNGNERGVRLFTATPTADSAPAVARALVVDALRGIGLALETVAALALMCDARDLSQTLGDGETDTHAAGRDARAGQTGGLDPTLFLFDAQPGGVGLAERIYERAEELLSRTRSLIVGCPCNDGCPACVGPTESGPRKRLALALLEVLAENGLGSRRPQLTVLRGGL